MFGIHVDDTIIIMIKRFQHYLKTQDQNAVFGQILLPLGHCNIKKQIRKTDGLISDAILSQYSRKVGLADSNPVSTPMS